jgi:thiol-disulfide isomerase/thioredoxin
MIAPEVARLAQQYRDVIFIKVDVDQLQVWNTIPRSVSLTVKHLRYLCLCTFPKRRPILYKKSPLEIKRKSVYIVTWVRYHWTQGVSASAGVTAMPTFQFYRSGAKVDEMRGANAQGLEQILRRLA